MDNIVRSPVTDLYETDYETDLLAEGATSTSLGGFYYCKSCDKGAKIGGASKRKLAALKHVLGVDIQGENVNG